MKVDQELDGLQDRIDSIHSQAFKLIDDHMRSIACQWQLKYPNHSIKFMDAMGVTGWLIDGEWIRVPDWNGRMLWSADSTARPSKHVSYEDTYTDSERARHQILKPLFDAMEWYADKADQFGVAIEFEYKPLTP